MAYGHGARPACVVSMQLEQIRNSYVLCVTVKTDSKNVTVTLENARTHLTRIWHVLLVIGNVDLHLFAGSGSHAANRTLMVLDFIVAHHMDLEFILGNETLWAHFTAERIHFDRSMGVHVFLCIHNYLNDIGSTFKEKKKTNIYL